MKKIKLLPLITTIFFVSWLGVLPSLLIAHGMKLPAFLKNFHILMTLGTLLVSVIFVWIVQGRVGLKALFSRLLRIKASPLVFFVVIGLPIIIWLSGTWLGLTFSNTAWPQRYTFDHILMQGVINFVVYLVVNTEEIAWRGVVFDQLLQNNSYIRACLILAPIWWLFHIPLFMYPGGHPAGYGLVEFTLVVLSQTFILGWIYIKTNRSVLYVHLNHQLNNGFAEALPVFPVFIGGNLLPFRVTIGISALLAVVLVLSARRWNKSPQ